MADINADVKSGQARFKRSCGRQSANIDVSYHISRVLCEMKNLQRFLSKFKLLISQIPLAISQCTMIFFRLSLEMVLESKQTVPIFYVTVPNFASYQSMFAM